MPFRSDDYTPHGYLDTPAHTRNLTPLGVLRSHGAGFRWHFPAYAGGYGGQRETYRAGFRVALDGALDLADFERATGRHHSKNLFLFDLGIGHVTSAEAHYHPIGDHALRALIVDAHHAARISVHVEYARWLGAAGQWGESGLVGRVEDDLLVLQSFEDGEAFVVSASQPWLDIGITPDRVVSAEWAAARAPGLPPTGYVTRIGDRSETIELHAVLGFAPIGWLEIVMARGKTVLEARRRLEQARRDGEAAMARQLAEDDAFWARAPRLDGDWPGHWRRGLVYDLETVRMMLKQPVGRYRHIWDAMQIQAPRAVLAEMAVDALLLGYADAELAQALALGMFLDAPLPNLPCSREDGTFNMVAADGSACGTAPAWCYPWLVFERLYALRPDRAWLERIYPRLAEYLDWWLLHRKDRDGWLVYACSWESGQDLSPRFGQQPLGGGHPIRHMRTPDLQAAFAHAAQVMARFAAELGLAHDIPKWDALAADFSARTEQLWHQGGYGDFDSQAGVFLTSGRSLGLDAFCTLLAPAALGIAAPERRAELRAAMEAIDPDKIIWPPMAWTLAEAALAAGATDAAARLAATICERAYSFWDARKEQAGRTLPGIACEYWPLSGRCGGEGYGWGALTTQLLLHALVGFAPASTGIRIRPNLPLEWRTPGARYELQLNVREQPLAIVLEPLDRQRCRVSANQHSAEAGWGEVLQYGWEQLAS